MTDASLDCWWEDVAALPAFDRPLRVLVLADPEAITCNALAAAGHEVVCCPDGQRSRGGAAHVAVVCGTAEELVGLDAAFDVVVAVRGWRRLLAVSSPAVLGPVLDWMRGHATVVAVEAPRRLHAPDLNNLGPFEVLPLLGGFQFLAETAASAHAPDPVVLGSDHALLAGGEWIAAADVEWVDADAPDARTKPVRTYRVPGERVVKVEVTSEEYFERAQVVGEAAFLQGVDDGVRSSLGLPRVRALDRGRAVTTLVRDALPDDGPPAAVADHLAGILDLCAAYAALGIFHNDVRPWNLVWHGAIARFVDFADTSSVEDDVRDLPQVLALAGTLAAVATDEVRSGEAFHLDVLDIADRADVLTRWPLRSQLTSPWLALAQRRPAITLYADMTAAEIMSAVLGATCE